MRSKFQPDVDLAVSVHPVAKLIDPEAYDASEQQFAASIEEKPAHPRFVADQEVGVVDSPEIKATREAESALTGRKSAPGNDLGDPVAACASTELDGFDSPQPESSAPAASLQAELLRPQYFDSWRNEVAARVNTYRARRRPRAPRYPSLQLKFEPLESSLSSPPAPSRPAQPVGQNPLAVALQETPARETQFVQSPTDAALDSLCVTDSRARILEFPRSAAAPPPFLDELAEPLLDRPRILEAPEVLPPPPALGGILIEPVEEPAKERRAGFELPLQAAPMSRRLWAGAIDTLLVVSAFASFAYIFFRVTSVVPPLRQAVEISVVMTAMFWIAYQYLLLVYTGTTPGLKLTKLHLSRFDGAAVPRKLRRWRVLASVLSATSLALGYTWCFLDEDRLCWHDRITRTYMAPQQSQPL